MNKQLLKQAFSLFGFAAVLILSACSSNQSIVCDAPYIRFADSCCLDQNDNKICDSDESGQTNPAAVAMEEKFGPRADSSVTLGNYNFTTPCPDNMSSLPFRANYFEGVRQTIIDNAEKYAEDNAFNFKERAQLLRELSQEEFAKQFLLRVNGERYTMCNPCRKGGVLVPSPLRTIAEVKQYMLNDALKRGADEEVQELTTISDDQLIEALYLIERPDGIWVCMGQ